VIRCGIAIYLWVTFPASASDRAGVIAAFVLGWVPLTCLNIVTAAGIARRKNWAHLAGLAVCGIGAVIDACFMILTVGYWTSEASPDWVFFDLLLWISSTAYVVVYVVSLIYLYRGYRVKSRTT
jgi:hypothetical protein